MRAKEREDVFEIGRRCSHGAEGRWTERSAASRNERDGSEAASHLEAPAGDVTMR
jgi:hypothetical protein